MRPQLTVYCDGASRKDGRGGWGYTVRDTSNATVLENYGGELDTTNNRMELIAAIEAILGTRDEFGPCKSLTVVSDSDYVVRGITEHVETWVMLGWRTSSNKPVKNEDLWRELLEAIDAHDDILFQWVKGHSGVEGNERADYLSQCGVPPETKE